MLDGNTQFKALGYTSGILHEMTGGNWWAYFKGGLLKQGKPFIEMSGVYR
jgi:hypothetical protein